MSVPAPLPPRRGDAAPSGPGQSLPPESFTGGRRDVPGPREFIPAMARDLGGLLPAAEKAAESLPPEDALDRLGDFFPGAQDEGNTGENSKTTARSGLSAELSSLFTAFEPAAPEKSPVAVSSMTGDTANSLSSLASALLAEPPAPARSTAASTSTETAPAGARKDVPSPTTAAELLETTRAAQFSLADLAGRLSSKLNTSAKSTAIDLLDDGSDDAEGAGPLSQAAAMNQDWGDLLAPADSAIPVPASAESVKTSLPSLSVEPDADWGDLMADPAAADVTAAAEETAKENGSLAPWPPPPATQAPAVRTLPPPAKPGRSKPAVSSSTPVEIPAPGPEIFPRTQEIEEVTPPHEPQEPAAPHHPLRVAPTPRTQPPPMPVLSEMAEPSFAGGVLILMLGGAALAMLGVLLACTLPMLWLSLKGADEWFRHVTWAAIIVRAALAGGLMALGMGSLLQKRWAPPLIHATGWVGALFASLGIAGITWHWAGGELEAAASSAQLAADLMLLVPSLAISLILILLYQRADLSEICRKEDPTSRWTDALPIPGLMIFVSGAVILAGGISMLAYAPAFPLPGSRILTGSTGAAAWVLLSVLGAGASFLSFRHHRGALWVLSLATVFLSVGPVLTGFSGSAAWSEFTAALGKTNGSAAASDTASALLAGLCPFPFILVLAMARRAFSSSSPSLS